MSVRGLGSGDRRHVILGSGLACGVLLLISLGLDRMNFDVFSGIVTFLALALLWFPILQWVARREGDQKLYTLLVGAWAAKFSFALVRYFVITVMYNDSSDAANYSAWGAELAALFRKGIFSIPENFTGRGDETERIALVVGIIYLVTGVSRYAATFVFTSVCFAGQVLMWRAFRRAVPDGDHGRYALLVFFLPSILFWPSSIGKEALMVGCVGLVSYGAAQLLGDRVRLGGLLTFLGGVLGLGFIRPHLALIAIVALGVGAAVGSISGIRQSGASRTLIIRVVALVVLIGAGSIATTQLGRFFGGDAEDEVGVAAVLEKTKGQTTLGGSEFSAVAVDSPVKLPAGVVTVLFRPFPWEASNLNSLIAASEGVLLMILVISGRRRLLSWVRALPRRPYLVFTAAYATVFIVAFSYIGNFGILARQRTQMMPLALTALAMPVAPKRSGRVRSQPAVTRSNAGTTIGS